MWALVVQIVDREQELMSTAGLQSLGGGAGLGRGGLDRELRIVPSKPGIHVLRYAAHLTRHLLAASVLCMQLAMCHALCYADHAAQQLSFCHIAIRWQRHS